MSAIDLQINKAWLAEKVAKFADSHRSNEVTCSGVIPYGVDDVPHELTVSAEATNSAEEGIVLRIRITGTALG